ARDGGVGVKRAWMLSVALLVACGGGGGGGGPSGPQPSVQFTPSGSPGANRLSLQQSGGAPSSLTLNLVAQALDGLYGVAFDLAYPASALRYASAAPGAALGGAGQTSLQVAEAGAGHLIVGFSRLGNIGGVPNAAGVVLTLRFDAIAAGS